MVRAERIELSSQPWEGHILPLNYARMEPPWGRSLTQHAVAVL
jgi:hypothetical protein